MIAFLLSAKGILTLVACAAIAGLFHRSVRHVLDELFVHVRDAVDAALGSLTHARERTRAAISRSMASLGIGADAWKATYIVGAVVATILFALFLACDYVPVALSLGGVLGLDTGSSDLATHLGKLMGISVLVPPVFAGWCLAELAGPGFLFPIARLSPGQKKLARALAVSVLVLSLPVAVALSLQRADSTTRVDDPVGEMNGGTDVFGAPIVEGASGALAMLQQPAPASEPSLSPLRGPVAFVTTVGLALSLLLGAMLAWEAGGALFLQLVPAGVMGLALVLLWAGDTLVSVVRRAALWAYGLLLTGLNFFLRIGIALVRPPVTGLRAALGWAQRHLEARRGAEGSVQRGGIALTALAWITMVATSWVTDVEIPEDGVGGRRTIDPDAAQTATPQETPGEPGVPPGTGSGRPQAEAGTQSGGDGASSPHVHAPPGRDAGPTEAEVRLDEPSLAFASVTDGDSRVWDPFPSRNGNRPDAEGSTR